MGCQQNRDLTRPKTDITKLLVKGKEETLKWKHAANRSIKQIETSLQVFNEIVAFHEQAKEVGTQMDNEG
jgi:hypothetical protein